MSGQPPPELSAKQLEEINSNQLARYPRRGIQEMIELQAYFTLQGIEAPDRFSSNVQIDSLKNRIKVRALVHQARLMGHSDAVLDACTAGREAALEIATDWKGHPSEIARRDRAQAQFYEDMERAAGCSLTEALRRQRLPHDL